MTQLTADIAWAGGLEDSKDLIETVHAKAKSVRSPIQYLGVYPIFEETRLYGSRWVIAPAEDDPHVRAGTAAIPSAEREALRRLEEAGLNFPAIYIAHELTAPARTAARDLVKIGNGNELDLSPAQGLTITREAAEQLVGPVPPPLSSMRTSATLGRVAVLAVRGLAWTVERSVVLSSKLALGLVVLPLTLVPGTDPIVFGAIPLTSSATGNGRTGSEGTPAAWFVLARWVW